MRLILAAMIPLLLFGGVATYIEFTERVKPVPIVFETARDEAAWQVTLYPIAKLMGDADFDTPALTVRFQGRQTILNRGPIPAGKLIEAPLKDVRSGSNSLFLQANIAENANDTGTKQAAIRVRIFRGDNLKKEQTFWNLMGEQTIHGEIQFSAPESNQTNDRNAMAGASR